MRCERRDVAALLGAMLVSTACGAPRPGSASTAPSAARAGAVEISEDLTPVSELASLDLGRRLDAYHVRDARWVHGWPLLVNREYDFSIAFGLPNVGPALAAAKRRDANTALASRLASLHPIEPRKLLHHLRGACGASCVAVPHGRSTLYGVLFGVRSARLRLVLESGSTRAPLYQAVTSARPLDVLASERSVEEQFLAAVDALAALIKASTLPVSSNALATCNVGDRARVRGHLASVDGQVATLVLAAPSAARLSCPVDALEREPGLHPSSPAEP
jgi:hypothetical protein